jgi:hypothetical protein
MAGQSGGQVMLCAVCTVHKETRSTCFLVEPQNQGRRVSRFWPQNRQLRFGDFDLKITATVSLFEPQNQAGYALSVAPQNQQEEDDVRHALRPNSLLHREASQTRISQFASKLVEERQRVVHIVLSCRSCEDEAKDGWVDAPG